MQQPPQPHLPHAAAPVPPTANTAATGSNHGKPFYKKSGAPGGYNGKKNFYMNSYGNAGQSNYASHNMHTGGAPANYHGPSHHMKTHARDRQHTATAGSGNSYEGYNNNYIKPSNNPTSNSNGSAVATYDTFSKSKELGSTGSLSGSNCSASTSLSKSNSGAVPPTGPKGNHQSGNWHSMNQWKSSRRNNYGKRPSLHLLNGTVFKSFFVCSHSTGNYMNYDSNRHNNSSKYDSTGNSSSASSGNSSTPATNDSPTSKSSTPEEYDQSEQRSSLPSSPTLNVETAAADSSQASSESNIVVVDSTVASQDSEAALAENVTSEAVSIAVAEAEGISQEMEKLTVSNEADNSEAVPVGSVAASTPLAEENAVHHNTASNLQPPMKVGSDPQSSKLSPNAGQFNSISRPPKHAYNTGSTGYQGYHQSNYYNKSGAPHSYHTYGRGNGGKKGLHGQSGYGNPNMHPAAIAAMKNQNAVPYLANVAGRTMHGKQAQAYSGMQLAGQHPTAMHPMAAIASPMAAPGTHLAPTHPGAAYMDGNMATAGLFPSYGMPAHMLPFYSVPHANQAHVHQQPTQAMMHQHAINAHAMSQHQQMMASNAAHAASALQAQQNASSQQPNNNAQTNSGVSTPSATPVQINAHASNANAQQLQAHAMPQQSSCDPLQTTACGDCCAPNGAPGYYGAAPLLNYPHGVHINYPFAQASLVPIQPYAAFGGAKIQPHFFSHPIGAPINYMDMNYMQFMPPNTYTGMMAAPNSAESHHHQSAGQVMLPAVVQSPPPNAGNIAASVPNEYGELSRPGSSYETQMMDNNYAVAVNPAAYDPHKQPYAFLGYMPQTGAPPMHQMPPNGADYGSMMVWQQEAPGAASHVSNHSSTSSVGGNSSTAATAGTVSTAAGSDQTSLTSQNFSTDSMVMVNYAVGSSCDTNNPTSTVTEIADK
jgi:hypothetical protein